MEIQYFNEQIPYIIIDDFYTLEEQNEMMVELDYLTEPRRLILPFEDNYSAGSMDDQLKNVPCQYLDNFYKNRDHSSILQITEKLFMNDGQLINNHPHWAFSITEINLHWTHVLYYEEEQEYKPHWDSARFTALTYFYNEPKRFSGGDLVFDDYDIEIECINNRVIVFPSILRHASTPVKMVGNRDQQKNGKFCITQFLDHQE